MAVKKNKINDNKIEMLHMEQLDELNHMKDILHVMKKHDDELKRELRETRILMFLAIILLFGLIGAVLGIAVNTLF